MKKKYLLLGIMALVLLSCDKINNNRMIWDISPVVIRVQVVNTIGIDLLNPDNQNSFAASGIKAVYNGKDYECNKSVSEVNTKAYYPLFYGLQMNKNSITNDGTYILSFGELDGAKSYSNEEITLFWGDGSSDKIKSLCFSRTFGAMRQDPCLRRGWVR